MRMEKTYGTRISDFAVGDQVRFVCGELHEKRPVFFPPVGTIGTVTGFGLEDLFVQWPNGTTSEDDEWFVLPDLVEKLE